MPLLLSRWISVRQFPINTHRQRDRASQHFQLASPGGFLSLGPTSLTVCTSQNTALSPQPLVTDKQTTHYPRTEGNLLFSKELYPTDPDGYWDSRNGSDTGL